MSIALINASEARSAPETATVARELVASTQLLGHELFSHASLLGLERARRASLTTYPFPLDRRQRGCES
jgi:hypothetical protein